MEAKEKAKELVEHYAETIEPIEYGVILERNWDSAKKCALIAVDELIEAFDYQTADFGDDYPTTHKYWKEVKHEIINL
jgi:hypothetical protein